MPWFVLLMITSTIVDYICTTVISAKGAKQHHRVMALTASITVNLGLLGFFKYAMFALENLNRMRELLGFDGFGMLQITLPIGISFYTFQTMSYTIDVYRRQAPPVKSFSDFSCFVSLFPQLIAGPIVRYNTVAVQLQSRDHTLAKFSTGTSLFILGFAKKILLANPMGEVADAVFTVDGLLTIDAWFGIVAYAFQIYFDFSGYSDMAIGLGRMLGFEFPRNFNAPYRANSITDFWRRWHISLSTFLRDYLYIPIGGNRKGTWHTYRNLTVVMFLGGLWHGANWMFVIWGIYHGILLCLERSLGRRSVYHSMPQPLRVVATFVLILFSWILFRSTSIDQAYNYFLAIVGVGHVRQSSILITTELYTPLHLLVMGICIGLTVQSVQAYDWVTRLSWYKGSLLLLVFLLSIAEMFLQTFNPFLYFQF